MGLPKRKIDLKPRSSASRRQAPQGPPSWAPRRRYAPGGGLVLFGVLMGVAAGYLLTDPNAWRGLKRAAGLPVAERPQLRGRPSRITDGDTFRLEGQRIRLLGVDAPEMSTPDGPPARTNLALLVAGSRGPIRCEDTGERTYGRVVAQCFTGDGRDLSAAMAEAGWATVMLRLGGWPYVPDQIRAMWGRRGIWAPGV